jgi:hypothetical protein
MAKGTKLADVRAQETTPGKSARWTALYTVMPGLPKPYNTDGVLVGSSPTRRGDAA